MRVTKRIWIIIVQLYARMSEIGKGLMSALSRIEPADDFSNAGRSLLQLDASFCGVMTTSLTCAFIDDSASCASTTGCALDSGECGLDMTQYDIAEIALLLTDTNFVAMTAMMTSCDAKSATQCSADITCDFDGSCSIDGAYLLIWLSNACPTSMTLIVEKLVAEGITQAQVQEEADAAGITISSEFQAEMDAQGVWSAYQTDEIFCTHGYNQMICGALETKATCTANTECICMPMTDVR